MLFSTFSKFSLKFASTIIASDEITKMLAPKVFTKATKYSAEGVEPVTKYSDEDNLIIKGNNLIMYRNKAADLSLDVSDIDEEYIKLSKLLFISGTALAASPSREAVLKAVELAVKAANGESVSDVDTGALWYTKDNMEDPKIAPCLYE